MSGNRGSRRSRPVSPESRQARPVQVQGVLARALKRYGLDKEIARYNFVLHWGDIVGDHLARRTKPECIRNRALVVGVSSSAWAQELSFQKQVILSRLREYLDQHEVVDDVTFYVRPELAALR